MKEVPEVLIVNHGERQATANDNIFHKGITYSLLTWMFSVIDPLWSSMEKLCNSTLT